MFAMLGEIIFEVLTSPEQFRLSGDYTYAEHKVVEAPPRLQWLANDLQKISLELGFHVAFTNPALQMTLLRTAAELHQAMALVFGNGVFRGWFVIESLEETHQQLAADGSYIAISARLELREWVPEADAVLTTPPRQAAPPPGIVQMTPSPALPPSGGGWREASGGVVFDPNQPISQANLLPPSAIVRLSDLGVGPGVAYSRAMYSHPGMSALVGKGPGAAVPGNPDSVPVSVIVRAG